MTDPRSSGLSFSTSPPFTAYERQVLEEIVTHMVSPSMLRRALELSGKPVESVLEYTAKSRIAPLRKISHLVSTAVHKSLESSVNVAARFSPGEKVLLESDRLGIRALDIDDLRKAPLEQLDPLADRFLRGYRLALGSEGMLLGAATSLAYGVPLLIPTLITADVTASVTMLSHHSARVAACYGFDPSSVENRMHVLAAMAPQHDSPDEGYLTAKFTAVRSIRDATAYLAKNAQLNLQRTVLEKEAPQLLRLVTYVANRLGVILTEKQLGMLVPLAGAAINGSLNVAFLQVGHVSAKDYFRMHLLEERYGSEIVQEYIRERLAVRKAKEVS